MKDWNLLSKQELINIIEKCNNSSALGPNKLTWSHIKSIVKNKECIFKLLDIANACIDLEHWPSHFKMSTIVIIPKPNKSAYDSPKVYCSIVLLNTIGKLFKKMIRECFQFHTIANNFVHQSQLGGLKQRSTIDAEVVLTHIIWSDWVKNLITSTLAFDIAQFFPSLNHQLLPLIFDKAGLDHKVFNFFKNYLVGRKTKYCWNNFISPIFNINIGVGQGSVLSPILSALYLSSIFQILEKHLKILNIPISMISFVNNSLFVSQNKSISLSNANLFCSYKVILSLLLKFGLIIKHEKTDIFHFSRAHGPFNPPALDLFPLGSSSLLSKETWKYLGFIFDHKLIFRNHIDFYSNEAILTIKCMKLLENLMRGINPIQKRWLYRCYALLIVLYRFSL